MVSDVVTVWVVTEVMLPCVKLGTTGTADAVLALARTYAPTAMTSIRFITHQFMDNSVTNCPVVVVPLPPPTAVTAPEVKIVPEPVPVPTSVDT